MKLKDLFKSYLDMSENESSLFINELRIKRIPVPVIKPSKKQKRELTSDEQALLDKVLGNIKRI